MNPYPNKPCPVNFPLNINTIATNRVNVEYALTMFISTLINLKKSQFDIIPKTNVNMIGFVINEIKLLDIGFAPGLKSITPLPRDEITV